MIFSLGQLGRVYFVAGIFFPTHSHGSHTLLIWDTSFHLVLSTFLPSSSWINWLQVTVNLCLVSAFSICIDDERLFSSISCTLVIPLQPYWPPCFQAHSCPRALALTPSSAGMLFSQIYTNFPYSFKTFSVVIFLMISSLALMALKSKISALLPQTYPDSCLFITIALITICCILYVTYLSWLFSFSPIGI